MLKELRSKSNANQRRKGQPGSLRFRSLNTGGVSFESLTQSVIHRLPILQITDDDGRSLLRGRRRTELDHIQSD